MLLNFFRRCCQKVENSVCRFSVVTFYQLVLFYFLWFCQKYFLEVFFCLKKACCSPCIDCFSLSDVKKSCSKLEIWLFLKFIFHVVNMLGNCFSGFYLSDHVSDICIFNCGFYSNGHFFDCIFRFLCFTFCFIFDI